MIKITRNQIFAFLFAGLGATVVGVLVTEFVSRSISWFEQPGISESVTLENLWFLDSATEHYITDLRRSTKYVQVRASKNYVISNSLQDSIRVNSLELNCFDKKGVLASKALGRIEAIFPDLESMRKELGAKRLANADFFLPPHHQSFIRIDFEYRMIDGGREVFLTEEQYNKYRFSNMKKEKAQSYLVALSIGANFDGDLPIMDCEVIINTDHGQVMHRSREYQLFTGTDFNITKMDNLLRKLGARFKAK